jgi:hypothetical protein
VLLSVKPAAPTPKPRLANALHKVHTLAPAYLLASAWIHASRAETTMFGGSASYTKHELANDIYMLDYMAGGQAHR